MLPRSASALLFWLILTLPLAATGQVPIKSGNGDPPTALERIHYGDLIDVDVVGSFDHDWRGTIDPEGFLEGPTSITERVQALCRTEEEVAEDIRKILSVTLRDPVVRVRIVDRSNRALAYLHGAIAKPQRFQLRRPIRLRELLILGGGISDGANGSVVVFRPANASCQGGGERSTMNISLRDLIAGSEEADPQILSGDIVEVSGSQPVFVIDRTVGGTRRYDLTPDMSLASVMRASGVTPKTSEGAMVRILRRGSVGPLEFTVRYALDDKREVKLEGFDVVTIDSKDVAAGRVAPLPEGPKVKGSALAALPLKIVDR